MINVVIVYMESNDSNFCVSCGSKINEASTVCSVCGKHVYENYEVKPHSKPVKNHLVTIAILSLIYAVFAIIFGTYAVLMIDVFIEFLKVEDPALWEEFMKIIAEDKLRDSMLLVGALFILSGVFAAITGIFAAIKKYYVVTLICCIISTVLGAILLIGLFGIIVVVLITSSKDSFQG